jgi:HSP20 family protein
MPNIPFAGDIPLSVEGIRREFDQLLDRVWHGGLSTAPLDGQDWAPSIDVAESSEAYEVRVEVPGLGPDDVEVSVQSRIVTIKGCKPPSAARGDDLRRVRTECRFGSFCRRLELPTPVQEDAVMARCKNGVLDIVIPKKPEAKGRTVTVIAEP